ncbi:hypothetical protein PV379_03315 [Streptomyces caniscabiei]|uniref:hypothetical protein n=1 Tax=Streptomyces caniscabiei TaxID=2746961 RepID=UPI0029A31C06|nr:hypothetical protein [Streptomyces caniscabiei]MDX2776371.1 hypothetical protein [Streptomyces caniscabiei]
MSEIELVLDSMRKTGECVSELEDALGQRKTEARQESTPVKKNHSTKRQRLRRRWRRLSWLYTIRSRQEAEYSRSQVVGRLREKEAFLSEVTKQLRELEASVDELTREVRRHHHY